MDYWCSLRLGYLIPEDFALAFFFAAASAYVAILFIHNIHTYSYIHMGVCVYVCMYEYVVYYEYEGNAGFNTVKL